MRTEKLTREKINESVDRRKFLAGLGAGAAGGLAGCGGDGDTETPTQTTMVTTTEPSGPVQGGRPIIGLAVAPKTLNPLSAGTTYSFYIVDRIYSYGTTNHPETLDFKPWAIADWTLQPGNVGTDSPTIKDVTLRDDLTFHDGEDVTADDYKFTVEYFKQQQPTGSLNANAHQNVSKVEKTGDYTVDVYMSAKDQRWFTNILGWPILPKHIWENVDDFSKYTPRESEEGVIGSGAWKLEDFSWQNWFELTTVDDYPLPAAEYVGWIPDEAPYVDGIRFEVFGSQTNMEQALLNGDIDGGFIAGGFTVDTASQAEQAEGLSVNQASEVGYNHMSYNMRRVPFDDLAFRQFLNKMFDKTWLIQVPYSNIGAVKGDYTVIPALERWRPPKPQELAGSDYRAENLPDKFSGTNNMPDLSFPGEAGSFNLSGDSLTAARDFLRNHSNSKHNYRWGENYSGITASPDGKELYVNDKPLSEAHTNNAGESGQGPLVFSFQPPQEDLYQSRSGQQFLGLMRKLGVPMEAKVRPINSQLPTIYIQEDFDLYTMGWGLTVNATHFAGLYSSQGADMEGDVQQFKFNSPKYTGADELIFRDLEFMDFSKRTPFVKQIQTQIYKDAPTNVTDVSQLLEPVNNEWKGWFATLGSSMNEDSFLRLHKTG